MIIFHPCNLQRPSLLKVKGTVKEEQVKKEELLWEIWE
jgi:hypothetical protein